MPSKRFLVSALIDFPDDCSRVVFTEDLLGQLLDRLHWMGVRRVYWNYYHHNAWHAFFARKSPTTQQTLDNLGDPMTLGCRMAHQRGMQFFAVIKPYETGCSHANPADSEEMLANPGLPGIGGVYAVDPWILARPEMRIRGRSADLSPKHQQRPIQRIQLRQKDLSPVRIKPEHIEIWTSVENCGYRKQDVTFSMDEATEVCQRDVIDMNGDLVSSKGDKVRVLNLRGLNLHDRFIAVTTSFDDERGTFTNTPLEMIRAFGADDQALPIVVASHKAVWRPQRDLRVDDLEFDAGLGDVQIYLDITNQRPVTSDWMGAQFGKLSRDGVIAFAQGRNEYLSGAACEAYPEVQAYWLSWVGDCIAAGVDGMDVRISNHSCWTNTPDIYGFNEPVVAEYKRRYGCDPNLEPYDVGLLGALRGEFFDGFLRAAKRRLNAADKQLQLHVEVESFRPEAPQTRWRTRPGNITFNWRQWLRSGLADEATLFCRAWSAERALNDSAGQEAIELAGAANIPLHTSHPIWYGKQDQTNAEWLEYAYRFDGISGYTLYESAELYDAQRLGSDGRLQFHRGLGEGVRDCVARLGILG